MTQILRTTTVDIGSVFISPDPVVKKDTDFTVLTLYKSVRILLGSEVKTESANAIAIKDGPSSIDLRGVSASLKALLWICKKYDDMINAYQYASGGDGGSAGATFSAHTALLALVLTQTLMMIVVIISINGEKYDIPK